MTVGVGYYLSTTGFPGGRSRAHAVRIPVTPGESLTIRVGSNGTNGTSETSGTPGGGGQASHIKRGTALLAASTGAGGGKGGNGSSGAAGGGVDAIPGGAANGGSGNVYPTAPTPGVSFPTMLIDSQRVQDTASPFVVIWYNA